MAVEIKKSRIESLVVTCGTEDGAILTFDDFTYEGDNCDSSAEPRVWVDIKYPRGHRLRDQRAVTTFQLLRTDAKKLFEELKPWLDE